MATVIKSSAKLSSLVGGAGASLGLAQSDLGLGAGLFSSMVMSEASLEIKAAVSQTSSGELVIEPLSSAHLAGNLNPMAVSTVKVSFVATASSPDLQAPVTSPAGNGSGTTGTPGKPPISRDKALSIFREQEDLKTLEKLLGPLAVKTQLVPNTGQWVLSATDPSGRLVREQIIRDAG
mgnify:CR=1 FL=1|jgi:hypothetical protein